jgi:hypothetical protein
MYTSASETDAVFIVSFAIGYYNPDDGGSVGP